MKNVNNKYLSYADQLKHSLWKEKRNSVLMERGSKCERCGDTNHLQVHHKKYIKDKLAWEYENNLLECLCGSCHMKEHNISKDKVVDTFGLKEMSIYELSEVLKVRTLIAVNLKSEIISYLMATCEVLKITDKVIRFKIHHTYHKYLKQNYSYCTKFNCNSVDFIIKKAVVNNNLMDFTKKY